MVDGTAGHPEQGVELHRTRCCVLVRIDQRERSLLVGTKKRPNRGALLEVAISRALNPLREVTFKRLGLPTVLWRFPEGCNAIFELTRRKTQRTLDTVRGDSKKVCTAHWTTPRFPFETNVFSKKRATQALACHCRSFNVTGLEQDLARPCAVSEK
jgi:hypothetical protein